MIYEGKRYKYKQYKAFYEFIGNDSCYICKKNT